MDYPLILELGYSGYNPTYQLLKAILQACHSRHTTPAPSGAWNKIWPKRVKAPGWLRIGTSVQRIRRDLSVSPQEVVNWLAINRNFIRFDHIVINKNWDLLGNWNSPHLGLSRWYPMRLWVIQLLGVLRQESLDSLMIGPLLCTIWKQGSNMVLGDRLFGIGWSQWWARLRGHRCKLASILSILVPKKIEMWVSTIWDFIVLTFWYFPCI